MLVQGPIWCFIRAFVLLVPALCLADVTWSGRVVDENGTPVSGAHITARQAPVSSVPFAATWQTQTDPTGAFTLTLPRAGDYVVAVERQGYYALQDQTVRIEAGLETSLSIASVREVFESVDVNEQPSPVDVTQMRNQEHLTGTEVNDIPYPNSHSLLNAMKLMPGVVEDPSGTPHFNGSSADQVLYLLNGFNIADPISSHLQTRLAVEGIRSLDFSSGRDSVEMGKGSAGVLAINTENGTNAFHYTATNFIPGLATQGGLRLGNWYPRLGVSGPIIRDRAWFSDTFDSEYNQAYVSGLPSGQNTRSGWAGSNLLHTQVNLRPANILFTDFLVNIDHQGRVGLGPLVPVPATTSLRTSEYFASLKDQVYLGRGMLAEFGYAHNYFSDRQIPAGEDLYVFSPAGRSGNYFVNSHQTAARDQGLVHVYLPAFDLGGSHRIELGGDGDLLHFNGDFHRTGYELIGLHGLILSQTLFQGSGIFSLSDTEISAYVLDSWRISQRLQLSLGIREDWDRRVSDMAWSPRIAFSWTPFHLPRTRISGGYAITHNAVPLQLLGLPLDQSASTTQYSSNGTAVGPATPTTFSLGSARLKLPHAGNWTLEADHSLSERVHLSAKYLRRRGSDGFVFVNALAPDVPPSELPLPNAAVPGLYQLTNLRQDNYDSVQISIRQSFSGQYEWMASYTRSRALSNAVLDYNASQPLQVLPALAPMPWDSPNRVLGWAYLPTPWKSWAISVLADARTGFPFSVQDQNGFISGAADSHRYPFHFDLNFALERMITLHGYRFALRGGVNNLTDQANPTAVNNVLGSGQFLQFLGKEGRHFVVRVRFFGRAGDK